MEAVRKQDFTVTEPGPELRERIDLEIREGWAGPRVAGRGAGTSLLDRTKKTADEARRLLKPTLPRTGEDGIPIHHEFEFELLL